MQKMQNKNKEKREETERSRWSFFCVVEKEKETKHA